MTRRRSFQLLLCLFLLHAAFAGTAAALQPATPAPEFALADLDGRTVRIAELKGKGLLLLFFFDAESRSSLDALKAVDVLARRHRSQLTVYGVSSSPPDVIKASLARAGVAIPVLRATAPVRELYQARRILPVGCVIGRDFKVLAYYQGGGEGFASAVAAFVERELRTALPAPASTAPAAGSAAVRKAEHPGKRQKYLRIPATAASPKPAATAPPARPVETGNGAKPPQPATPPPAATAPEPHPRTPDRSNPQNSLGKILNDNEW